eukprot:g35616.t1
MGGDVLDETGETPDEERVLESRSDQGHHDCLKIFYDGGCDVDDIRRFMSVHIIDNLRNYFISRVSVRKRAVAVAACDARGQVAEIGALPSPAFQC